MKIILAAVFLLAIGSVSTWYFWLRPGPALVVLTPVVYDLHHEMLSSPSGRVEIYAMEPTLGRPWPAILFVPGDQDGARIGAQEFVKNGLLQKMAEQGFAAVAVSLPGYGGSQGSADFGGPRSQDALKTAIKWLRDRPDVRAERIAVWGNRSGAVAVANVLAGDRALAGAVLQNGVFSLFNIMPRWRHTSKGRHWINELRREAGLSRRVLRERSTFSRSHTMQAPILAVEQSGDSFSDVSEVQKMIQRLRAHGADATLISTASSLWGQDQEDFLKKILR